MLVVELGSKADVAELRVELLTYTPDPVGVIERSCRISRDPKGESNGR